MYSGLDGLSEYNALLSETIEFEGSQIDGMNLVNDYLVVVMREKMTNKKTGKTTPEAVQSISRWYFKGGKISKLSLHLIDPSPVDEIFASS